MKFISDNPLVIHGYLPVKHAYDASLGEHAPARKWDHMQLSRGVNELDITAEDMQAWQTLAAASGVIITKSGPETYTVTDLHAADFNDGVRHPRLKRPTLAHDSRSVIARACSSRIIVSTIN